MGDGGVIGVFDGFTLSCGEIWSFASEEGGGGDVILGIVGVFPDEEGRRGLDYVFATEEDANETGRREGFDRAIFCELQCKVGEAGSLLVRCGD